MRRIWFGVLALSLLAVVATTLAFGVARRLAPSELRAATELSLSRTFQAPVSVEAAELSMSWFPLAPGAGLQLRAWGIEAWPDASGPALSVARVEAKVDLLSLLFGEVRASSLRLTGARLRLTREPDADGEAQRTPLWTPARIVALATSAVEGAAAERSPENAAERVVRALLPATPGTRRPPRIELLDARLLIVDRTRPKAPTPLELAIDTGRLTPGPAGIRRLEARGRILAPGASPGAFELEARHLLAGPFEVRLELGDADLALARGHLPPETGVQLSGRASGELVARGAARTWSLDTDLALREVRGTLALPGAPATLPIELPSARWRARAELDPDALRIERSSLLTDDGLELTLAGALPFDPSARSELRLGLEASQLAVARVRGWLALAPDGWSWAPRLLRTLGRIEAGRLRDFSITAAGSVAQWRALAAGRSAGVQLALQGRAEAWRLRLGTDRTVEALGGRFRFEPDRLELANWQGRLDGAELPRIEATLNGASRLLGMRGHELVRREYVGPLAGLGPLGDLLVPSSEDAADAGETGQLALEADWLAHPVVLWPLEQAAGRFEPHEESWAVEVERGRWGGVPVRGRVEWHGRNRELALRVEALGPRREAPRTPTALGDREWARGRWELGRHRLGGWSIASSRGSFRALGDAVELTGARLRFEDVGTLSGEGSLVLSHPEMVPIRAALDLEDGAFGGFAGHFLGFEPERASGSFDCRLAFEGWLRRDTPLQTGLMGEVTLRARDGEIQAALPSAPEVVSAKGLLGLFEDVEQGFRFRSIEADLRLAGGLLYTDHLAIDGPDVRLVASGEIDVARPDPELQAVVGLFFLEPVDWMIGKIPLLNDLLLGADKNLFGAYIALEGPWERPDARLIPTKTLVEGPANLLVAGVPRMLWRVVHAMRSTLGALRGRKDEGPAPATTWDPQ